MLRVSGGVSTAAAGKSSGTPSETVARSCSGQFARLVNRRKPDAYFGRAVFRFRSIEGWACWSREVASLWPARAPLGAHRIAASISSSRHPA